MAGVSQELGNRIIEGLLDSMQRGVSGTLHLTNDGHEIPEEFVLSEQDRMNGGLIDKINYDIAHRLDLEVPVVYYKGLDKIVIGTAKITSGGVADIMIGGFDGEDFGNVLHPDALHVSIGLQQPMRWMPEMRINSIKYPEEIYENLRRLRELDRSVYEAKRAFIDNKAEPVEDKSPWQVWKDKYPYGQK